MVQLSHQYMTTGKIIALTIQTFVGKVMPLLFKNKESYYIIICCCFIAKLCLTLCDPVDCSLLGSSVHRILQARLLEWVAIPFSRVFFLSQGSNLGLLHCRQIIYLLSHQGSPCLQRSLQLTCTEFSVTFRCSLGKKMPK